MSSVLVAPDGNILISADTSGLVFAWDLTYCTARIKFALEHRAATAGAPKDVRAAGRR
jgi:hypothetical protein